MDHAFTVLPGNPAFISRFRLRDFHQSAASGLAVGALRASFGIGSVCVTLATNAGLSAGFFLAVVDGNIVDARTLAKIPAWFSYLAVATLGLQGRSSDQFIASFMRNYEVPFSGA